MSQAPESENRAPIDRSLYEAHNPRMLAELEEFWKRMPGPKRFDGARVMDFGCGTGEMTVDLAKRGAAYVLGVEVSQERVDYARERVDESFPELAAHIEYTTADLDDLDQGSFDFIVTKDTFEHVIGLDRVLPALARLLRPGGELLAGFSPLWYSMFGDHGLSRGMVPKRLPIPWLHVLVGEKRLLAHANEKRAASDQAPYESLEEFGFNRLGYRDFEAIFQASELEVVELAINRSSSPLVDRLGRIPVPRPLEKYWVRSVYARLRRPEGR